MRVKITFRQAYGESAQTVTFDRALSAEVYNGMLVVQFDNGLREYPLDTIAAVDKGYPE